MDDDDFPEICSFNPNKYIKTYSKPNRKMLNPIIRHENGDTSKQERKNTPLTSKNAVKYLLEGTLKTKVCRFCLNETSTLSGLDDILQVAREGVLYKVTIRDMVASFHPFKIADDPDFPNKICDKCLDHAITSYKFTQQCEQAGRALRNCLEDMYEKLEKLDPLDRPKKRGRQKLNPNYNRLYAEHRNVIDYAEPIMNLIHTASESLSKESAIKEFECLKCCQVLPNIELLLNHENSHPKSMWYNCRLCGKSFPKKHQLRKHMKMHLENKPITKIETSFSCKKCGVISKDYSDYLQHLEKHKFKLVMEHLIEGKMDKLCSICLDRSANMTELEKMVCLHGGCPELSGDRSLYNVIATTLPDPKLYKYQELVIPKQAIIMKLVKMDNQPSKTFNNSKNTNTRSLITVGCFDISNPIIISKDNMQYDDLYTYFFSEPLKTHDTTNEAKKRSNSDKFKDELDFSLSNEIESQLDAKETMNLRKDNIISPINNKIVFNFTSPKYIDDNEIINHKEVETNHQEVEDNIERFSYLNDKLCKTCWIFNKATCEKCIENVFPDKIKTNDHKSDYLLPEYNKTNVMKMIDIKLCSYCWVFKHVGKCHHCNKPIKNDDDSDETLRPMPVILEKYTSKYINLFKNTVNKSMPWKCNVCLSTNTYDRKTCICCESIMPFENTVKVKLGNNPNFLKIDNKLAMNWDLAPILPTKDLIPYKYTMAINKVFNEDSVQDMDVENTKDPEYDYHYMTNFKQEPMDGDNGECFVENLSTEHQMDIEDDHTSHCYYVPNNKPDDSMKFQHFQFQIGTKLGQDNKAKQHKRHLGRMVRPSRK